MSKRDNFLIGWSILIIFVTIFGPLANGESIDRGLINVIVSIFVGVVGWFLIWKLIFFIYDSIKRTRHTPKK